MMMNSVDYDQLKRDLEVAWERVNKEFPFRGYIRAPRKVGYLEMVRTAIKWLGRNGKILDFGAGPCDKTAMFSYVGFDITAFDDFQDYWHKLEGNKEKILPFARSTGIDYYLPDEDGGFTFPNKQYDALMMHGVVEHLHDSPRELLNRLLTYVRPNGYFFMSVPNAAHLRKRLFVLLGRTNYAAFEYFYWTPGPWRGHVREYVKKDIVLLARFLGLEVLELRTYHLHLEALPAIARPIFVALCRLFPGFRESWILVARKPSDWKPRLAPTPEEFARAFGRQYYAPDYASLEWGDMPDLSDNQPI